MKRKVVNKWVSCQMCHQLRQQYDEHSCPPAARAKKEAELDIVISEELESWNYDQRVFWKSKDVRFTQHLLDTGQYD